MVSYGDKVMDRFTGWGYLLINATVAAGVTTRSKSLHLEAPYRGSCAGLGLASRYTSFVVS